MAKHIDGHFYKTYGPKIGICSECGVTKDAVKYFSRDHNIAGRRIKGVKHWLVCGTAETRRTKKAKEKKMATSYRAGGGSAKRGRPSKKEKQPETRVMEMLTEATQQSFNKKLRVTKSNSQDIQIEIYFVNGEFRSCDYYGMEGPYDREDWIILAMIEKEIAKIEKELKK